MTVAEQMREKALSKEVVNRYNNLIKDIENASNKGELSLTVPKLSAALIRLLNDDGFVVESITISNKIQIFWIIKW
jgi:ribosomal protein S8